MMARSISPFPRPRFSLAFALLGVLLAILWLAGGASRGDVLGQVVVRGAGWASLIALLLFGAAPDRPHGRTVLIFLVAVTAVPLVQLIPLPPELWRSLPGRDWLARAAATAIPGEVWRPWSMVPSMTRNAASSLVVPAAVLACARNLEIEDRRLVPGVLLILIVASMLVGLLQFSGAGFANPLVNDTPGEVSGTFANRNHFALLMAIGCLLTPVWALSKTRRSTWRAPLGLGLLLLLVLTLLATGSRSGILVGVMGLAIGLAIVRHDLRRMLRNYPRWVASALAIGSGVTIAALVGLSVLAGRALSVTRLFGGDPGQDMRTRALPTVLGMIREYLPAGSGMGSFDAVFRIHEPFALLKLTYFNHAHNDWFEIVIDAGIAGAVLLVAAVLWWGFASLRAWRLNTGAAPPSSIAYARAGSGMLLLVMVASVFDYPARTPIMMALIVLAALWLEEPRASALPASNQHL